MPVYLDRDISGDGVDTLAGGAVIYAVIHLSVLGPEIRPVDVSSGYFLRAGWIAFGDVLAVIGGGSRDYWREPQFLNFADVLWTPNPSTSSGAALTLAASRIRWHLSTSTVGHIYVFGA